MPLFFRGRAAKDPSEARVGVLPGERGGAFGVAARFLTDSLGAPLCLESEGYSREFPREGCVSPFLALLTPVAPPIALPGGTFSAGAAGERAGFPGWTRRSRAGSTPGVARARRWGDPLRQAPYVVAVLFLERTGLFVAALGIPSAATHPRVRSKTSSKTGPYWTREPPQWEREQKPAEGPLGLGVDPGRSVPPRRG
jgi:hypothetical protein